MKKVVFLLGTMSRFAPRGDALSSSDLRILEEVADAAGVEADVVFATQTILCAKNPARASMKLLREERDRVIEEIKGYDPDVVIVFGPIALKSITDKGNIPLNESMRQQFTSEELDMPFVVTYSMDMVNAKPGVKKWLILDTLAAVNGQTVTEWGDYVVLDPSDDSWDKCPSDFCELSPGEVIGFDLETYPAFDPWHPDARIRMAIISREAHKSHIIQLGPDSQLPRWLHRMAETPLLIKAGSNIKFDYKWLRRFGCEMRCMQDTSVSEHIIDETNPYKGLKHLTFIYAPWLGDYSKEHRVLVAERGGWEFVEDNEQYQYAGGDGEASYCTAVKQRELIKADGLQRPFILSHDLYVVLCEMEHNGCMVDMDVNADLDVKFQQAMSVLRSEITDTLGPINPGSPKVLADALKDKIPGLDLTKTKMFRLFQERPGDEDEEEISTNRATLEREAHKHPIIETVLRWRRLSKLHSTYVVGIRDKYRITRPDGIYLSTTFRGDVVETNRLSSQGPNLQNQPSKPDPDDPHPIPLELNTKLQFISRFDDGVFMEVDEAQIEIRMAAMLSNDPKMIGAIESGEDIHTAMAATLLNKKIDDVTGFERQRCKKLTFLILYGGGANTLSKQLGIKKDAAKELIADYFKVFNRLDFYINTIKMKVKRDLFVESVFGYRRRFVAPANWMSPDGWRVERQAWNHIVQNTAAGVMYCALIKLRREMKKLELKSLIILTVHDSIGLDVHPDEIDVVARLTKECMENPDTNLYGVNITIPLEADVEVGPSWGEKKKYEFVN
jgi:DNA polymerase I-like protein with 3'-5' exonuclease and polymerase domains